MVLGSNLRSQNILKHSPAETSPDLVLFEIEFHWVPHRNLELSLTWMMFLPLPKSKALLNPASKLLMLHSSLCLFLIFSFIFKIFSHFSKTQGNNIHCYYIKISKILPIIKQTFYIHEFLLFNKFKLKSTSKNLLILNILENIIMYS